MDLTPDKYHQALTYLTINSSFLGDLGLFHGRMGIVLFFAHYARVTQNKQYEDFAEILLDEIYEEIHWDLPINLENGLCGIGWGIEYLVQNGFMKGNTDEILADIDRKVLEIDPLRISDLSFRRGLAGIIFYVIARLNANRETINLPFDQEYLDSLQKALENKKFTEEDKNSIDLAYQLKQVLNKEKIRLILPNFLIQGNPNFEANFDKQLLGLEEGLTGLLWNDLKEKNNPYPTKTSLIPEKEKCIYLIDEESRSSNYGIGTYIRQIIYILQPTKWDIVHVILASNKTNNILIEKENNKVQLCIAKFNNRGYKGNDITTIKNIYYRNAFFALFSYFKNEETSIFHLNTMQLDTFATFIKQYFNKPNIILTVHYTNWSFELLGNRKRMQEILDSSQDSENQEIRMEFEAEKHLMQLCDKIIAIAKHSYNDIITLYNISPEKVILIPHGLKDNYIPLSEKERTILRQKYGFTNNDFLILFVGRIDKIKGIEYLIETFKILIKRHLNIKLIIAGDGNFNLVFSKLNPVWSNVICTGFINKSTLNDLYSISDIGILPSLHEEFGFVALEMMMMKLPVVASKTTGLSDLIKENECGLSINWYDGENIYNTQILAQYVSALITDGDLRKIYANKARSIYTGKYSLDIFKQKMIDIYNNQL